MKGVWGTIKEGGERKENRNQNHFRGRKQTETERGKRGHWSYGKGQKMKPESPGTAKEKPQIPRARYSIEGRYKLETGRKTSISDFQVLSTSSLLAGPVVLHLS